MRAKLPETEAARLQILHDYKILDTPMEAEFDDFTLLASQICGTSIALISLIDEERQWFKSRVGLDVPETCRDAAFCAHALHHTEVFLVPDAQKDPRFYDNPLVTGEPFVRFYAGAPLLTAGGHALGTLCVIDPEPRTLSPAQQKALQALARQVMARLELRRGIAARTRAEQKLRESEALKAAVLHTALDSIITINANGQVVEWNPAAETTFGYPAALAVGRDLTALIIPAAYQDAHRRGMAHYLATGEGPVLGRRIEITAMRADGAEFPVELAIVPIRLASGPLFTATLRDISDRKAAEKALETREEQYRLLFEHATHGIYRTTPDGRILLANPALLQMLGYDSFEQLTERNLEVSGTEAAYYRSEFKARLETAGELRGLEAVWRRRDGQPIFICENAYLVRDADGQPLFYEGSVEDITARKEAEEALRRAHDELEARVEERTRDLNRVRRQNESLLLAAGEGIYGVDAGGRTTFVNPAAARMLGWAEADLLGRPMHALLHHRHADGSPFPVEQCPIYAVLRGAEACQVEDEVFWREDGTSFPVEYMATPLLEEGRVAGAVVTFQDISARREAAEALRRSEMRYQRIAANVPGMVFQSILHPEGAIEFHFVSEGCRAIYGLSPAEICANSRLILDMVHPEDRTGFETSLAEVLARSTAWHWEGRIITQAGEIKWLQGRSHSERLPNGDVLGEGLVSDVTARQRAQEALAEANRALSEETAERQNIMETVPDILFRLDLSGRLTRWNRRMETVTGLSSEQLQDSNPLLLFVPAERDAVQAAIVRAFETGYAEVEASLLVADGTSTAYQFSGSPMKDPSGRLIGITGIGRDVTARNLAKAHIQRLNDELTHAYDATIEGWSRALDLRDHETEGHSRRVTEMTLRLAAALGVSDTEMVHIRRGALLHDIGKMAVPDGVLLKPGPLTDEEWVLMRRHPALAYEMLLPIEFLRPALDIPLCHHEKWDGSGYPCGRAGAEIPLAARLFALVDVWDALSSDRPYRRAWAPERVLDHLRSLAGTHFDPQVVEVFLRLMEPVLMSRPLARAA